MNPLNLYKTNTTRFMLAMILKEGVTYNDILKDGFIDSHHSDFYRPENDGCIIVVKSTDEPLRGTLHDPIRKYQRDDDFIFVYEVPDEYIKDYNYIVKGKYSELDLMYKIKLLKFWEEEYDEKLVPFEWYSVFFLNKELQKIYNYNIVREAYRIGSSEDEIRGLN